VGVAGDRHNRIPAGAPTAECNSRHGCSGSGGSGDNDVTTLGGGQPRSSSPRCVAE